MNSLPPIHPDSLYTAFRALNAAQLAVLIGLLSRAAHPANFDNERDLHDAVKAVLRPQPTGVFPQTLRLAE